MRVAIVTFLTAVFTLMLIACNDETPESHSTAPHAMVQELEIDADAEASVRSRIVSHEVDSDFVGVWEFAGFDVYMIIGEDGFAPIYFLSSGERIFDLVLDEDNRLRFSSEDGPDAGLGLSVAGDTLTMTASNGGELPFTRTSLEAVIQNNRSSSASTTMAGVWEFPFLDAYFIVAENGEAPLYSLSDGDLLLDMSISGNSLQFNGEDTDISVSRSGETLVLTTADGRDLAFTRTSLRDVIDGRNSATTTTNTTEAPSTTVTTTTTTTEATTTTTTTEVTTTTLGNVENGRTLYASTCSSCHGTSGQGAGAPSLVGCNNCGSFSTLQSRISNTMPQGNAGSCTDTCANDIAAFILEVFN